MAHQSLDLSSRIHSGTDSRWSEVSNPIARQVIATAHAMLPSDTHHGPAKDDVEKCPLEIVEYTVWLEERLPRSGLAKALAGGPEQMPDITLCLGQPWRWFAHLFRPRNYRQLTAGVIKNLEWYMDQSRVLRDPAKIAREQFPMSMLFTVVLMLSLSASTPLASQHWVILTGVGFLFWLFSFLVQLIWGKDNFRHKANCALFYHYIVHEYMDVDEDEPGRVYDIGISRDWKEKHMAELEQRVR